MSPPAQIVSSEVDFEDFNIDPCMPSANPPRDGIRYGHSFIAEREISPADELREARLIYQVPELTVR